MPDPFTAPPIEAAPIVQIGAHAAAIGVIAEELGLEMVGTLARALLLEVGRETARHIAAGTPDVPQDQ